MIENKYLKRGIELGLSRSGAEFAGGVRRQVSCVREVTSNYCPGADSSGAQAKHRPEWSRKIESPGERPVPSRARVTASR
jgi:hypothetical protein